MYPQAIELREQGEFTDKITYAAGAMRVILVTFAGAGLVKLNLRAIAVLGRGNSGRIGKITSKLVNSAVELTGEYDVFCGSANNLSVVVNSVPLA